MFINDLIKKENLKIEDMIYELRGKQVLVARDLTELYHIETMCFIILVIVMV
ncbi:MAG TPA: hypothetical protein IAB45_03260 [Candidatus Onthousia faecavium]|nr:hypothetical protein [Candidatus Onthousia faecavium]